MSSDHAHAYAAPSSRLVLSAALYAEIRHVLELREQGCICTPGRLRGGPAVHAEDIPCLVHRQGVTS